MHIVTLQTFLQTHPAVKFIRFESNDFAGVPRIRLLPVARALQIAGNPSITSGISTASPSNALGGCFGGIVPEHLNPSDDIWVPDWSSLRECTYAPSHASVRVFINETICPEVEQKFACDPRSILKRVIDDAREKHNVYFQVGFELEFTIMESRKATSPLDTHNLVFSSGAVHDPLFAIVEESVLALEQAGVEVWGFHQEGEKGVYEIALSPQDPLEAADNFCFARETIKTIAVKHGKYATLHPKPFENGQNIGLHTNLSLSKHEYGDSFFAGYLKHFRGLGLLTNPGYDSYERRMGFSKYAFWAQNHKWHAINRKSEAFYEFRIPDALSNVYLMLSGIIGCGMRAVEDKESLMSKPDAEMSFAEPSEERRKELGITTKYITNLEEAIEEFRNDTVVKEVLGEVAWQRYIKVKEQELGKAKTLTSTERRFLLFENI